MGPAAVYDVHVPSPSSFSPSSSSSSTVVAVVDVVVGYAQGEHDRVDGIPPGTHRRRRAMRHRTAARIAAVRPRRRQQRREILRIIPPARPIGHVVGEASDVDDLAAPPPLPLPPPPPPLPLPFLEVIPEGDEFLPRLGVASAPVAVLIVPAMHQPVEVEGAVVYRFGGVDGVRVPDATRREERQRSQDVTDEEGEEGGGERRRSRVGLGGGLCGGGRGGGRGGGGRVEVHVIPVGFGLMVSMDLKVKLLT